MANAFTDTSAGAWDRLTETAYDRVAKFALRDDPQFRQLVDTKPENQAMPGDVVTMTIHSDLGSLATTPLTETVDPDSIAASPPSRVNITLNEYGTATLATVKLNALAFTQPKLELAELVGRHRADTLDALVRAIADSSTNVVYKNGGVIKTAAGSVVGTTATDLFTRDLAVTTKSLLARDKVTPKAGGKYVAVAHSDVLFDLMAENSATAWIGVHTYGTDTAAVYAGEVGEFMGTRYISTTRNTTATDGAGGTVKVYRTYVLGQGAIAEAVAIEPGFVVGPVVDKLKRFNPLGWYGILGWSLYRAPALRKVYSASSLGGLA